MRFEELSGWLKAEADLKSPGFLRLLHQKRQEVVSLLVAVIQAQNWTTEVATPCLYLALEEAVLPFFRQSPAPVAPTLAQFVHRMLPILKARDPSQASLLAKFFGRAFQEAVSVQAQGCDFLTQLLLSQPTETLLDKRIFLLILAQLAHPDFNVLLLQPCIQAVVSLVAACISSPDLSRPALKALRSLAHFASPQYNNILQQFWPSLMNCLSLEDKRTDKLVREIVRNRFSIATLDLAQAQSLLARKGPKWQVLNILILSQRLPEERLLKRVVMEMTPEWVQFGEKWANPGSQLKQQSKLQDGFDTLDTFCEEYESDLSLDLLRRVFEEPLFCPSPVRRYSAFIILSEMIPYVQDRDQLAPLLQVDLNDLPKTYGVLRCLSKFDTIPRHLLEQLAPLICCDVPRLLIPCLQILQKSLGADSLKFTCQAAIGLLNSPTLHPSVKQGCFSLMKKASIFEEFAAYKKVFKDVVLRLLQKDSSSLDSLKMSLQAICSLMDDEAQLNMCLARYRSVFPQLMESILKQPWDDGSFICLSNLLSVKQFQEAILNNYLGQVGAMVVECLSRSQDSYSDIDVVQLDTASDSDSDQCFQYTNVVLGLVEKMATVWGWCEQFGQFIDTAIENQDLAEQAAVFFENLAGKPGMQACRNAIALRLQQAILNALPFTPVKEPLMLRLCALGQARPSLFPLWQQRQSARLVQFLATDLSFSEMSYAQLSRDCGDLEEMQQNISFRRTILQLLGHLLRSGMCRQRLWQLYSQLVSRYFSSSAKQNQRVIPLYLTSDLVESFDYPTLAAHWQAFTQFFYNNCQSKLQANRIAATWGLALVCDKSPTQFLTPIADHFFLKIAQLISQESTGSPKQAKDNVTAALGFLLKKCPRPGLLQTWVSRLPFDTDETSYQRQWGIVGQMWGQLGQTDKARLSADWLQRRAKQQTGLGQ